MAITVGEGEGGGVVSSLGGGVQFCPISPSDNVGIVENLMKRIEELEKAVSQLLAVNIAATQLSDLSEQIGWVYNVTYMGIPGWIQTETGTLIPPPGFSLSSLGLQMSDGSEYPVVSVDSDGVLQFGFDSDGHVAGSQAPGTNYLILQPATTTITATYPDISSIVSRKGTAFGISNLGSGTIDILQAGLYHIDINFQVVYTSTPTSYCFMLAAVVSGSDVLHCKSGRQQSGSGAPAHDIQNNYIHISFDFECIAGGWVNISFSGVTALIDTTSVISIQKVG